MTLHHSKHMGHDCAFGKVDSEAEFEASYTSLDVPLDRFSAVKVHYYCAIQYAIHNMKHEYHLQSV